jgi:spore maturation protein CgeB
MHKVVIIGQAGNFNLEGFVSNAFEQLGWNVARLNIYENISELKRLNTYVRMLATRSFTFHRMVDYFTNMESKVISSVVKEKPELVLVFKGEVFPPKVAERISKEYGIKTALWFPDDPRFLRSLLLQIASYFDCTAVSSKSSIPSLKESGAKVVIRLPFACEPNIHRKLKVKQCYDVTFIGSYYPERARLLSNLVSYDLKILGGYWNSPWISKKLKDHVVPQSANGQRMVEILNRSKVTLNIHNTSDLKASAKVNMRVFEATGCGTFLLTDMPSGLSEFFDPGREVVCYSSPKELVELVEYYLESPEERQKIAENGQARTYKDHTYVQRVSRLLDAIGLHHDPK